MTPVADFCSYGGGVQSTALLVLAATGRFDCSSFLFANVGPNAENPETIAYFHDHALPYAAKHGLELAELRWVDRKGNARDLYDDVVASERSIDIPVRLQSGAFANRKCTHRYKTEVVAREVKHRGYGNHRLPEKRPQGGPPSLETDGPTDNVATVAIGFSTDEIGRVSGTTTKGLPWVVKTYPLIDLMVSRTECLRIVRDAGLPQPPKSSCWFCPFQGVDQWRDRKRNDPALFAKAVDLEVTLNTRRANLGRDRVGLASAGVPLDQAIDDQLVLDGMDGCDSGWCMA